MNTVEAGLAGVLALAAVRFALLPGLVRLAWRAPRVPERGTPARLGLPFLTVRIPTAARKHLHGWLITQPGPAPALVLMHGWGGNAENLLPLADVLYRAGWTVLLVDARNHGRSDGDGFSSMVKFAEDVDHALDWLRARPEVAGRRVALVGHSVGAAAVLLSASRRPDVAAVVSLAAFAHPREIMRSMMSANRIPYLPVGWWILGYIERAIGARYDAIAPLSTIGRIACPVLLVHGAADRSIPVADAHAIYAARARANTEVRLMVLPGADHRLTGLHRHASEIVAFLAAALGSGGLIQDDERHQGGAEPEGKHRPQRNTHHQQP
jgi:dipeptidyl aminopeptidase/acylaminoacyl peptidase